MQLFNVFFVFFVTLTIFPAIQADVEALSDELRGTYFTPVTAFLFFNLFAMVGNVASHWTQAVSLGQKDESDGKMEGPILLM